MLVRRGPMSLWGVLLLFLNIQRTVLCWSTDFGGYISGKVILDSVRSPYEIRKDVIIQSGAHLIISPGVELKFAPGTGITVLKDGILEAKGSADYEIIFTRLSQPSRSETRAPGWLDARLVDGDSILQGRLQLLHNGEWRSVCTNSKNWTEESLHVMCRQLGFSGGHLYNWFPKNNDSSQLLYEDPQCNGNESSLFECPNWTSRRLGSGVCDYQSDIGIQCGKHLGNADSSNWRGIFFQHAQVKLKEPVENKVRRYDSLSKLEHVRILYAGRDVYGNATPALEVIGQPPIMKMVVVEHSAFDAINVYKPTDVFSIENSVISGNRGYGVFVNTSLSQITFNGVIIEDNGGDGIHFVRHESYGAADSFCDTGNIRDEQIYPVYRSHVQKREQHFVRNCEQMFEVASWTEQVLTVNFMGLTSDFTDPNNASRIEVYDGATESSRHLATVPIINNTFPQSVTSTKQKILLKFIPIKGHDASFVIEILANQGKAYDLNITKCNISNNQGKGVTIQDMRSGLLVNESSIDRNNYLAGLDVSGGSGDVMVNNSVIRLNKGDGINITYAGGFIHIDQTSIANNEGRGFSFWSNETSTHKCHNYTAHITKSEIVSNGLYGILIGNQCVSSSIWNISMNSFRGNEDSGLLISSCWKIQKPNVRSKMYITHNEFVDSNHLALEMSPVLHAHVIIEHNQFKRHKRGVIFMNGLDDDDFLGAFAKVEIQYNYFTQNLGKFVANIGVAQGTSAQKMLFFKNELENNVITEPFLHLNPRSRVAAVVVVSSQNTDVYRNRFQNFESAYELGSHVERHNIVINATFNFWGATNVTRVYGKIFDRKDRYNLARVEFLPFLMLRSDLDTTTAISDMLERDKILRFRNDFEIGGEVPGIEFLRKGTYVVKRDIYVHPGTGQLRIDPGVVLKFERSIGMMVQGLLFAESESEYSPITFTIDEQSGRVDESKVRLSDGMEGLLEVYVDGNWGSVCDYGWDIEDASIACNQMGFVLHPEDWILEQSEFDHGPKYPITLSNVQCSLLDTDITQCKAEKDFENSCSMMVGLRCYQPSWSGIRLGMAADRSNLKNVVIEYAGLLDYATNSFKPALQIDFNKHYLQKLKIHKNMDSGIGIKWNEMFVLENRQLLDSQLNSNRRHGLVVHSQGLNVLRCDFSKNEASGIYYNPMFTKSEQRDLISWINLEERGKVIRIPDDVNGRTIHLNTDEYRYLVFTKTTALKEFSLTTTGGRSIGIVVLNPFGKSSSENMTIYGRLEIADDVIRWDLRENLTAFPLRTPGYGVLVEYNSGEDPSGQGIIYIASVDGQRDRSPWESHPTIHIDSAKITDCSRGIYSHHFNRDISDHGDHFHRYTNETILVTNTVISGSKMEAIFVWTPFWDPVIKNLAEINYTIINTTMYRNSKGLLHYSRDIRNSNNLFHWTINNTGIEDNAEGGIDVRLPYVWQYSENYTHSFSMHKCSLMNNRKFEFLISGHFAKVNMSGNRFRNNNCKKGIMGFYGMEKELLIEKNVISDNSAVFGVEFNLKSHANKFGLIPASFHRNIISNNRDIGLGQKFGYQPTSYALAIRGVQLINVTRNVFNNPNLQFELLTGVLTGSVKNKINVGRNWWGYIDPAEIQKRIFDFDDWNGYAIADFNPYLGTENIDGGVISFNSSDQTLTASGYLNGRLYSDLTLPWKSTPYVVTADLTIMPGVTLTLDPGVVVEFYPSVGILALGDIVAVGKSSSPIIMKPARIFDERRFRRQTVPLKSRLCIDEKCDTKRPDGFLEIYNATTEQWVPICDARFTERNAQVVCKELGYNNLNVQLAFGPRLDMVPTLTSRVRTWPHPLECIGTESALGDCEYRLNGYVESYKCPFDGDYVYIYCGSETLVGSEDHWGGIRFSIPNFETSDSPLNRPTLSYVMSDSSRLEYVHIRGAGVLHNEKSAALQLVQREIQINYVNISESASHGIETVGVSGSLSFDNLIISNNMGIGINILSLTGESFGDASVSKLGYDPLKSIDMSYGIFGMVDMCDMNKEMGVENRILLYYKYDNQPVDCVKIFSSLHYGKQVGFRLLQFNLFDGTKYAAQPDFIQIYDGDVFNDTTPQMADIGWHHGYENATKFYVSTDSTLSILLHTIGGSEDHGFIAEVVTLPISHPKARDSQHNVSYSEISNNGLEGIAYRSAGEITPAITLRYNRIDNNGRELFGNFTAGNSAILLDVQNAKELYFYNNLIMKNQGGLLLRVDSRTAVSALNGIIVNNLFTENKNREVLNFQGRKAGAFQFINVFRNYFTRNYAQYRDTIFVSQVISNLTENLAYNNTGKHLLDVRGFERMPLSFQTCEKNWFWRNVATDVWDKSTIIAGKAGQQFNFNYLVNPDNDFELSARNRSLYNARESFINAKMNWWGFNGTAAISGRIKDYSDFEELLEVEYYPFLHDNSSVLSGKCAGGWKKIGDTCFLYVGGVMTYAEAKRFCELDNASMPYVKTKHDELMDFVKERQFYYQHYSDRFWIQSLDIPPRECAVLVNRKVVRRSCTEYFPFLCERDPEITVSASLWFLEPLTLAFISVTGLAVLFAVLCVGFWLCKSRQRYREKLERRNSIRASIRSNRSLTGGFSELGYKRRLERAFEAESSSAPKTPQLKMNGSLDSVDKTASRFSCSMDESYENTVGDTSSARVPNGNFSAFVGGYTHDAQLENRTANLMVHPTFDLTYENQCFVDRSASRNSHEISRDWSSSTGSTLDMKRSLERETKSGAQAYVGPYQHSPSLASTTESNDESSRSSCRQPPLETAM